MASRFGRNQKRKLKEQVTNLVKDNYDLIKYKRAHSILLQKMDDWDYEIKSIIGQQYTAFSPYIKNLIVDYFPDLLPVPLRISVAVNLTASIDYYEAETPVKLIRFLATLSEEDLMKFRRIIRLRMSNGKELCYAINEEDLHNIKHDVGFRNFMIEQITKEFANMVSK